jgi:hypothetical protein
MTAVVKTRTRLHARLEEAPGWYEPFWTAAHTDGAAGHDDEDAGFGVGRCHLSMFVDAFLWTSVRDLFHLE